MKVKVWWDSIDSIDRASMGVSSLGKTKAQTEWREYPEPIDNQGVIRTWEQALRDLEKIGEFTIIREIEDAKLRGERIFALLEVPSYPCCFCCWAGGGRGYGMRDSGSWSI